MVRLMDRTQYFAKSDHMDLFFKNKETDCVLYSKEGGKLNVHKEVLAQTDFLRNIISSNKDCWYSPVPNKHVGANKHVWWKILLNLINM